MNNTANTYSTIIGGTHVTVVVFGNKLDDLIGSEMDGGDPFWYIIGTDAWFEKREGNGITSLVARTFDKEYFSVPIDEEALKLLETSTGMLVLLPNFPLKAQDIKQTSDL